MTSTNTADQDHSNRFHEVEDLLKAYPAVSNSQVKKLKHWLMREASAIEVADLARKESCGSGYRQFRTDHLDRLQAWDILLIIMAVPAVATLIAVLVVLVNT